MAFRICKMYLKQKRTLFVLQMATALAGKFGNSEAARGYKTEAENLERQIDSGKMGVGEEMVDDEEEIDM